MNKNDTVLMLEGINEDTKQELRGWILLGTPENTGDGPARVPLANNEVITGDPCWHPWGWETGVLSLAGEDPPEEGMATHSSLLAWRIPWTEEPGGATVHAIAKSQTRPSDFTFVLTL